MKRKIFLFLTLGMMILGLSSFPQTLNLASTRAMLTIQNNGADLAPQVWPGIIVIKFKEGVSIPPALSSGPVVTGIPSFDQKAASVEANSLVKRFHHKPIPQGSGLPDISRIYRLKFPENFDPVNVAELFSADPNVEYAEPEPKMHFLDVPKDPMYPQQQYLPQIIAEQAWDIHKGENGTQEVKIAFIDTGVDWCHVDLTNNTWENLGEDANGDGHTIHMTISGPVLDPGDLNGIDDDGNGFVDDLIGWDFYEAYLTGNGSNPDPNPGNSVGFHGTHCAGIACATTDNGIGVAGISWNVKYMPVQVDINNDCSWGYDGIVYAADMGADVISCSWGGYYWQYYQFGADVIAYAKAKGSIVVCAAGNENIDGNSSPAFYPGAVSVASVNGNDTKTAYSTYGAAVDVSAPGGGLEGGILSTLPGNSYGIEMGTSMATPLVAGLMGLVKSYHPDWTNEQVTGQVIASCDSIDSLNPMYVKKLGSGRINAYQALLMTGAVPPQELKLQLLNYSVTDADNDGKLEPGDTGTISFRIRNYTHCTATDAVNFNLSTDDTQIEITGNNFVGTIDSDSIFVFNDILQFTVKPGALSHTSTLKLTISADIPVVMGNELNIPIVVAPSGFFVYEKAENARDYSGTYIRKYLERMGYEVTYSNCFPQSLMGFDAAFLSMGNLVPPNWEPGTLLTEEMAQVVVDYLKTGGKMYIEGGGVFYIPQECYYSNSTWLKNLFGILSINVATKNPLDKLSGINGTVCQGMEFTSSSQYNNNFIEKIFPGSSGTCPLEESNHGKVAIYNTGIYGQKTFYLAYSLADLKDVDKTSSRYNLLNKIMEILGYPLPPGYLIPNFTAEKCEGGISEDIAFTDLSLTPSGVNITSWQWDFQNDGIIDSYEKNPVYAYNAAGSYDVRLVVSNGGNVSEVVYEDFITIRQGMFVYEGIEDCQDMSGTWMKDFLEEHFYPVTYANEVPRSLSGYDAVFLSFGTPMTYSSTFEDGFARMVKDYLQEGGKVYLEGGFTLSMDQNNPQFLQLFGIQDVTNPFQEFIVFPCFDTIVGKEGSICNGFEFDHTNQVGQFFIDQYVPNAEGVVAFEEPGYANVAIQHEGANNEKTFCFSWALAELEDGVTTKEQLMWAILGYFNLITGLENQPVPKDHPALRVYPNPFAGTTTLEYELEETAHVHLSVYNHLGQQLAVLEDETQQAGMHQVKWNAGNLPAGIYYCRLQSGDRMVTMKIIKVQ